MSRNLLERCHVTVGMHNVDLARCVGTHGLLQRHILDDAGANRRTLVTHHGFCNLELLCDQMLWLSLGVPITEPRRAVRTGRVLPCLAGTSSIQVITR